MNPVPILLPSWLVLACLMFCLGATVSLAATRMDNYAPATAAAERRIKAAFLYKFAGYLEWPEGTFPRPDTPITIAVLGDDQLAEDMTPLVAGRTVDGRPLVVRRQNDDDLPADTHILFIGRAETARLRSKELQTQPILVVTESESALSQGSTINFVTKGARVRFEVSLESAEKRRLKLSSRLLGVAQAVHAGTP
jgi:hypothetical protein